MKKLLNFRPVFFIALGIIIFLYSVKTLFDGNTVLGIIILVLYVLCSAILCVLYGKGMAKRNLIFFTVLILLSATTCSSFLLKINLYEKADLGNTYYEVEGRVSEVQYRENSTLYVIKNVSVHGAYDGKVPYKIALYVSGDSDMDVGDIISGSIPVFSEDIYYEQRLSAENIVSGIKYYSYANVSEITVKGNKTNLFEKANLFLRNGLKNGLKKDEFAVAYALICGNSEYTGSEVFTGYRNAGVAHIFAVSGLHIGFVATVLYFVLKRIKINPYIKVGVIGVILFFYSGVCGFSASSIRASVMCTVLQFSGINGNKYDALSSLSLSAVLILLFSPLQLFCAGFILSFGVVLGIIVLRFPLGRLFSFLPKKLASSLALVVSAQLFGIPLCILLFGEFSTIAILLNLVLIPIVGVIFIITFVSAIISGAFSLYKILIPMQFVFKCLNTAINYFDLKKFMVGGIVMGGFVIFYYLAMFCISDITNLKRVLRIVLSSLLISVFGAGTFLLSKSEAETTKVYVLGNNEISATAIIDKGQTVLVVNEARTGFTLNSLKSFSHRNNVDKIDVLYVPNFSGSSDVQGLVSRLRAVFIIDAVYYCGEENAILNKSFENIEFYPCGKDGKDTDTNSKYSFIANGYGVKAEIKGQTVLMFSSTGKDLASYKENGIESVDLAVAYGYLDGITSFYLPKETVSYLRNKNYSDGESAGSYKYKIK